MALGTDYPQQDCSLARALEVAGERWSMLIIRDAFYGVRRFNDFLVHLDIPRAVLTSRLQSLVAAGVLEKVPYQQSPVRYDYALTEAGRELWLPIYTLARWGERHARAGGQLTRYSHTDCGEQLDHSGCCPRCGRIVPPEEVTMQRIAGTTVKPRQDPVARAIVGPRRLLTPIDTEAAAEKV
ncbi:MAG TPA: helix-turn-helix domain-containing protein [Actinocrinis sp.]|jgi:DNA-binding HxlR family transcriptional regulator